MTEEEILSYFAEDKDIQTILHIIRTLNLHDTWLCAGTVRNFIWNILSGKPAFDRSTDIDVIFYDPNMTWEEGNIIEEKLKLDYPNYQWELRNQSHMHTANPNTQPYTSSCDAMSRYPETCTAVGLRLTDENVLELFCPYGLESISSFEIHPTPHFLANVERMETYRHRLAKKDWMTKWPQLTVFFE